MSFRVFNVPYSFPNKVAITGATGFIGTHLARYLTSIGVSVVDVGRRPSVEGAQFLNLSGISDLSFAKSLRGCRSIIHLAGQTNSQRFGTSDQQLWNVNREVTLSLARQASAAGIQRFVFLSSLKVNGDQGRFSESNTASPVSSYGKSKLEAESCLRVTSQQRGMEWVVVRSPMVYGPGVKGNFATLVRLVRLGIPLPFARVQNRRSMVGIKNLVSFLTLLSNPDQSSAAANEIFFVSDGESISTADLITRIASAYEARCCLIDVPSSWLWGISKPFNLKGLASRLLGSLEVDISKSQEMLGWFPTIKMQEELKAMAIHDSLR